MVKAISTASVHERIALLFGLMAALVLVLVGAGLFLSLNAWLGARRVVDHNVIAAHTLTAVKNFSFERGRTNVVLSGKTPISDKNRAFIDERRAKGDAAVASAVAAARQRFGAEVAAVERSWDTVRALRAEVERDFRLTLAERDRNLPGRWLAAANEQVARLEAVLVRASQVEAADYAFTRLAGLRLHVLQFRNTVGTESTRLAGELSAQRVPDVAMLLEAARLRGDAQRVWSDIERAAGDMADKDIAAALQRVREALFGGLRPMQDGIVEAARQGRLPEFGIESYMKVSVPALDSIVDMVDSVDRAAEAYASQRLERAGWLLGGSLTVLLALFGLIAVGRRELAVHLIEPLQSILARIRGLSGAGAGLPTEGAGDLAAIHRALDVLERSLAEIEVAHAKEELSRAELERSEQRLRTAIDAIGEAFVIFDTDDRLVFFNEEYRRVYPSIADQIVLGKKFEEIIRAWAGRGQAPEADTEAWIAKRVAAHREGTTLVQQTDGGRWMRIVERATPDGQIVGFRVDITDLIAAKEAAEASNRAKGIFLATMSHEIRTPLNGVLGMAQMLASPDVDDAERIQYARTILESGKMLLAMLTDILDLSKIEAGHVDIASVVCDPAQIVQEVGALFGAVAREKGLDLQIAWNGADTSYVGDPLRLRQMLSNYVGNAVKFTDAGMVRIEGHEVARDGGDAMVEFSVRDTGPGIPEDKRDILFKPFSQLDSSFKRQYGGTGLGLSIVRNLARLMGGDVGVDSRMGEGARFWFRVRLKPLDVGAGGVVPEEPAVAPSAP